MERIGVVGAGSIGSVLAEGFSQLGHPVFINDKNPEVIHGLDFEAKSKGWLADYADVVVFALPTPTTDTGGDASIVEEALECFQDSDATLVLRSTMPPGETGRLANKYDLKLVYSPEFLRDRSDVNDFFHPDRIVLAGPHERTQHLQSVLDDERIQCDTVITTEDYLTAEIAKEAHNAFFATKVSFANQMRMICEQEGADVQTVMDVITADSRNTSSHLDPLLGPYGGKCLPKDTEALAHYARFKGAPTALLEGTVQTNRAARERYENKEIQGNWPEIDVRSD